MSLLFAALIPLMAYSGGFSIPEQGSKAAGLGGAFTGLANDPSAIYFNPAGISQLSGFNLLINSTIIIPKGQFQNPDYSNTVYNMKDQTFFVPSGYFTYTWEYGLSFGFGVYAPYGLGTEYDKNWPGDQLSRKIDLKNIHYTGAISYKPLDMLSVGVSFAFSTAEATLIKDAESANLAGDVTLDGSGSGVHYVIGVLANPIENLNIGAVYKGASDLEMTGKVKFTEKKTGALDAKEGDGTITLPLPSQFNVGLAYNVMSDLTVTADLNWTEWSRYSKLEIILDATKEVLISSPRLWENTVTYRVGAEYRGVEDFAFRAGLILDGSPVPEHYAEPSLPDNNRIGYTFGLGYKLMDNLNLDAYLLLLSWEEKHETNNHWDFNGYYNQRATLSGLSISYQF